MDMRSIALRIELLEIALQLLAMGSHVQFSAVFSSRSSCCPTHQQVIRCVAAYGETGALSTGFDWY